MTRLPPGSIQCKRVATVLQVVTSVTYDPSPTDDVARRQLIQFTPQILIENRPSIRGAPTVHLPPSQVLRDALLDVLRICHQFHLTGLAQSFQSVNRGGELHSIVGCLRFAS
jgi:hypothetical protein